MAFRKRRGALAYSPKPAVEPATIPASVGGVNSIDSLAGMAPTDCIYTYNIMPSEYGLRLRKGYREWATGVPSDVRSIVAHDQQDGNSAKDRLFAVCADGIYNVTLAGTTSPTLEVPFTGGVDGGYGVHLNFTTDAAEHLILYADNKNGMYQYDGDTFAWSRPSITGPDVTNIAYVMSHKQRVWLIEDEGEDAWYLPVDAIAGQAAKFNFGSKFIHGGRLMALFSWSLDGGDGVDDFLVAVSKAGDVLVYYGSDPSEPDWSLRGSWFIGEVPDSRRIGVEYGPELYLLSIYGLISLRDLLNGVDFSEKGRGPGAKIARYLRDEVTQKLNSPDWELRTYPGEGFLQISTPWSGFNVVPRQYNMNFGSNAWGWWLGVPILSAADWKNEYMMGGPDGVVYIHDGGLDGTKLTGEAGLPIEFRTLTSFQPYGAHAQFMRAGFIRPIVIAATTVNIDVKAIYDYNFNAEVALPPSLPAADLTVWDSAMWDTDTWDFAPRASSVNFGASGLGRTMAVGMAGSASDRITLVAWDVMFQKGGLL